MAIGLTLSGGGFRATAFHLGVVRYLRDAGLLEQVTHICSVSGGSILAAHLVLNWNRYTGSEDEFLEAQAEVQEFMGRDIRGLIVRRAVASRLSKLIPEGLPLLARLRRSRADLLERYLAEHLYDHKMMESLPPHPHLHILATNMTTGGQWSFVREGISRDIPARSPRARPSDHEPEILRSVTVPVALAVTVSAAFPALFRPILLSYEQLGVDKTRFVPNDQAFTDGGVFDNLGVRKLLQLDRLLSREGGSGFERMLISDAGAAFERRWGEGSFAMIRTAVRATDILGKRIYDLERGLLDEFEAREAAKSKDGSRIVDIRISTVLEDQPHALIPAVQRHVQYLRTDLDRFSPFEKQSLIQHGYFVARHQCQQRDLPVPETIPQDIRAAERPPHERQVRQLQAGSRRKLGLASLRDPATYVQTLLLLIALLLGKGAWDTVGRPAVDELHHRLHPHPEREITISGKSFLESAILVEMMALQIKREVPDFEVRRHHYLYDHMLDAYGQLTKAKIQLYPEYSGTVGVNFLERPANEFRAGGSEAIVAMNELLKEEPVEFLKPFGYTNNYVIVMHRETASCLLGVPEDELETPSLSELARAVDAAEERRLMDCLKRGRVIPVFGSSADFMKRPDGLPVLTQEYGLRLVWKKGDVTHDRKYAALRNGDLHITDGYELDPELRAKPSEFVVLADNREEFPSYWPAPLIRKDVAADFPEVKRALQELSEKLAKMGKKDLGSMISDLTVEAAELELQDRLRQEKPRKPYAADHLSLLVERRLVEEDILDARSD